MFGGFSMIFLYNHYYSRKKQLPKRTKFALVEEYTSFKNNVDNICLTCSGSSIPPHFSEPTHSQCQFGCLPSTKAESHQAS